MKKTKKILSVLLVLMMAVSMLPMSVLADVEDNSITNDSSTLQNSDKGSTEPPANSKVGLESDEVKTVSVYLTSQADGTFLHAPQTVEVSSNLAESYDYTDKVTSGVSALDVLVKAQILTFGEDFTKDTAQSYLVVLETGYISKLFGEATMDNGFMLNGAYPNDGTESEWGGYNGTTVTTQAVTNGDSVSFFIYQDQTGYSDNDAWFEKDNAQVDEITAYKDRSFELKLKGISYMSGYLYADKAATVAAGSAIGSAQLALVNSKTGELTDIEGKTTDENGAVSLTFDAAGTYYLTAYMTESNVQAGKSPIILNVLKVKVAETNASITVPSDATLFVGSKPDNNKKHFVPFTEMMEAYKVQNDDSTTTYYFDLTAGKDFNYRVSGDEYVTYAGKFKAPASGKAATAITVTKSNLQPAGKSKSTVDKNTSSNKGYNVADIYLNINEQGYLKLNTGNEKQIVNLRNWEAVDTTTTNYFIEPDYHYEVYNLSENGVFTSGNDSVVSIGEDGKLTAVGAGTAIVLVSYDAINVTSAVGGPFFGAIWPENTGVFVVSVDKAESGIQTNMTINEGKNNKDTSAGKLAGDKLDAELDVIYFLTELTDAEGVTTTINNAHGEYTFTPSGETSVSVANPNVTKKGVSYGGFASVSENKDGSYTVSLSEGRNIVKVSNASGSEYQVITAKGVKATVSNVTSSGKALSAGDEFSVTFDTVYHPANKLSGVYNMSANITYSDVSGYEDTTFGSTSMQYNFASNTKSQTVANVATWGQKYWMYAVTLGNKLSVPADYTDDELTMAGGYLVAAGYGDPFGNHRGITLESGKAPNLNASIKVGYFGKLPDLTLEVKKASDTDVKTIEIATQPKKTSYYEGDTFDPSGLSLTVTYEDGSTRAIKGGFTYSEEELAKDQTTIEVGFGGKTAEVTISVQALVLNGIEITTPPTKTSYTAGEYFNPSGMLVTAKYNSGDKAITGYTYDNEALTTSDSKVTIKYTDEKLGTEKSVDQAITVNPASSSTTSDNITVSFTLLGDSIHGDSDTKHTLKAGNLTTWIPKTSISVEKGSKVIDVLEKALSKNGIGFKNDDGNYVSEIKGLAEFTNGELSGWMYTLNGVHSELGVAEQTLTNGDKIVFHYTDDYTVEQGSDKWNDKNHSSSGNGESKETTVATPDAAAEDTTVEGLTYNDVKGHWALDSIKYVSEKGLMNGTSSEKFKPNDTLNRAMLATIIYRLAGSPAVSASGNGAAYADVTASTWYSDAIAWASANGIVTGYTDGTFRPDAEITRQELAAMLYRYAGFASYDVTKKNDLAAYTDKSEIGSWALESIEWANAEALVNGRTEHTIVPSGTATRAEAATILMRFSENIAKTM